MDESEEYRKARQKVEALKGFYTHLFIYIVINLFLVIVNFVTSPDSLWFYWVTIAWGLGLILHAFDVFGKGSFFGKEWEERKTKELMKKH